MGIQQNFFAILLGYKIIFCFIQHFRNFVWLLLFVRPKLNIHLCRSSIRRDQLIKIRNRHVIFLQNKRFLNDVCRCLTDETLMADRGNKDSTPPPLLLMPAGGGLTLNPPDNQNMLMPVIQSEASLLDSGKTCDNVFFFHLYMNTHYCNYILILNCLPSSFREEITYS